MEKRVFAAILVSYLLVMFWMSSRKEPEAPANPETNQEQSTPSPSTADGSQTGDENPPPQVTPPTVEGNRGVAVTEAGAFDGDLVLQSETLRVLFDQRGAAVDSIWLLEFEADPGAAEHRLGDGKLRFVAREEGAPQPLGILDDTAEVGDAEWAARRLWQTDGPAADGRSIEFRLPHRRGNRDLVLVRRYEFGDKPHRMRTTLRLECATAATEALYADFWLRNSGGVWPVDRALIATLPSHSTLVQADGEEADIHALNAKSLRDDSEGVKSLPKVRFAADHGFYFSSILGHADAAQTNSARVAVTKGRLDIDRTYSEIRTSLVMAAGTNAVEAAFDLYVGPKDHRYIRKNWDAGPDLEQRLTLADAELMGQQFCFCIVGPLESVVKLISKAVVWLLSFFGGLFGNMGAAILVLTVLVRAMMFPITRKSQVAMQTHAAKMARVKPKLEALQQKYGKDRQRMAAEQMKLFKQEGVSMVPLGGCLPIFLQMPIFFGLFAAIRFDIDLRHAGFLWCPDLSMPDAVVTFASPLTVPCCFPVPPILGLNIFPLLMIAAMFLHQLGMPKSPDPQMQSQQKMMMFMPILFGVMMYGYAAGLSVYWLASSLFGIFEQRVIKKLFPIPDAGKSVTSSA